MKNTWKYAFKEFAEGNFEEGLRKLNKDERWQDDNKTLDGPFYLGFPGAQGWGEGLLAASLLKRHAASSDKRIRVLSEREVCSILANDHTFCAEPVEDFSEAQSKGARPPLAILRRALTSDLLELPFEKIDTGSACPQSSRTRPLIGLAWASISSGRRVNVKSIPIDNFLNLFESIDVEVISFQRELGEDDCKKLHDQFRGRCSIFPDCKLDRTDQTDLVREIGSLDCMVTISTTTAHIAACLGVPVVLLAAKRSGQQWFWRAQRENGKCFYPSVDVVLGGREDDSWWQDCIDPARKALSRRF